MAAFMGRRDDALNPNNSLREMSTHRLPGSNIDGLPDVSPVFEPIYTNFLVQIDEPFANECAETRLFSSQPLGNMSNMALSSVTALGRPFSVYISRDEYLDADTYSWHECLQIIDEYEWPAPNPVAGKSLSAHGVYCASPSLEIAPTTPAEISFPQVVPGPDTTHATEASELFADASRPCDSEDPRRDHPASPPAFQNDVANETVTAFIARPAPAQRDTPTSITPSTGPEDTAIEKKMVIEYPPTPAMSMSELQSTNDDVHSKSSPTTELDAIETFDCDLEARIITMPSSARATSHYRPPTVIDQFESDDRAQPVRSPFVPSVPPLCADNGQIIVRPPRDFHRAYLMEEVVNVPPLPRQDSQAFERAQTAVALPKVLNTKPAQSSSVIWPDTPLASLTIELQENDLTSVMAALASYSLSTPIPTHDLKRPFNSAAVDADTVEEHLTKRQKLSEAKPVAEEVEVEEKVDVLNALRDEGIVASRTEIDVKLDVRDSVTHGISPAREHISDKAAKGFSGTHADLAVENPRSSPRADSGDQLNSATPTKQLVGGYVQSPNMEMEERVATASMLPTLVSSVLPSVSSEQSSVAFDTSAPIKSEANDEEEHEDIILAEHLSDAEEEEQHAESDTQESDELSEADEEEISLLANEVEASPEDVQDATPPMKESIPAPLAGVVENSESETDSSALTNDNAIAGQSANAAHAVKLRHEAESHYERRATRSETRTSDRGPGTTSSAEEETDALPVLIVKQEDRETDEPTSKPRGKQTRGTTVKPAAPKPKASVATRAKPTPNILGASKSTSRSAAKPVSKAKPPPKQGKATTIKPKPKAKTPVPPQTFSTTAKSHKGADAKTTAISTKGVLGKRKTRRSSALEEEIAKVTEAENNIAKRLRSKDAE